MCPAPLSLDCVLHVVFCGYWRRSNDCAVVHVAMQVGDWLVSAGLSRYAPTFREKEICGEDLVTILGLGTDLSGPLLAEDLGVTSEADRVFLLRGFRINLEKAGACFLCRRSKPRAEQRYSSSSPSHLCECWHGLLIG